MFGLMNNYKMINQECSKKRMYFTPSTDIDLLKEVIAKNPWGIKSGWSELASYMRRSPNFYDVETKSLRDRTNLLIARFRKEDMSNLRKSGTDEEYVEREILLQYVSDLEKEHQRKRQLDSESSPVDNRKKAKMSSSRINPLIPAVEFIPDLEPVDEDDMPPLTMPTSSTILDHSSNERDTVHSASPACNSRNTNYQMRNYSHSEGYHFKERELDLKQQELKLKRDDLELRRLDMLHHQEMAKKRLEIESKEKERFGELMQQQITLMQSVISALDKH